MKKWENVAVKGAVAVLSAIGGLKLIEEGPKLINGVVDKIKARKEQ